MEWNTCSENNKKMQIEVPVQVVLLNASEKDLSSV